MQLSGLGLAGVHVTRCPEREHTLQDGLIPLLLVLSPEILLACKLKVTERAQCVTVDSLPYSLVQDLLEIASDHRVQTITVDQLDAGDAPQVRTALVL
jgi:hypothetical protein